MSPGYNHRQVTSGYKDANFRIGKMNTFFTQLNTICIHAGSDHLIQNTGETAYSFPPRPEREYYVREIARMTEENINASPERTGKPRIIRSHIRNEKRKPAVPMRSTATSSCTRISRRSCSKRKGLQGSSEKISRTWKRSTVCSSTDRLQAEKPEQKAISTFLWSVTWMRTTHPAHT